MNGIKLIADSETKEGLRALRDILGCLTDEEFGDTARGLLGGDKSSSDVLAIVGEEGAKRVNNLLRLKEHRQAVEISAASCSPALFLNTCLAGLRNHDEEGDPVRIAILDVLGDCPDLVNQLRSRLAYD